MPTEDIKYEIECTVLWLEVGASAILSPYSLTTQQVGDLTALKLSIIILLSNKFNQVIFIECSSCFRH